MANWLDVASMLGIMAVAVALLMIGRSAAPRRDRRVDIGGRRSSERVIAPRVAGVADGASATLAGHTLLRRPQGASMPQRMSRRARWLATPLAAAVAGAVLLGGAGTAAADPVNPSDDEISD